MPSWTAVVRMVVLGTEIGVISADKSRSGEREALIYRPFEILSRGIKRPHEAILCRRMANRTAILCDSARCIYSRLKASQTPAAAQLTLPMQYPLSPNSNCRATHGRASPESLPKYAAVQPCCHITRQTGRNEEVGGSGSLC